MAKHSTALATRPIIIAAPRRSSGRRAMSHVKRGGRHVARHAKAHLPVMALGGGALALGYLDGHGTLDMIPAIGGSRMTTLAIGGFALTRLTRNSTARAVGLAALAAGLYDFGREQAKK